MTAYQPLTKTIKDEDGNTSVVCRYSGTDMCRRIHNSETCHNCPMLDAILEQLHVFEEIYLEENDDHDDRTYN